MPLIFRVLFITDTSFSFLSFSISEGAAAAMGQPLPEDGRGWRNLGLNSFNRSALDTTQNEDRLMAAAPNMGFSFQPSRV